MIATKFGPRVSKPRAKVPPSLVYEIIDGQPIHYHGYREVMAGKKTLSDIMGSSKLQAYIIAYVFRVLIKNLSEDDFIILSNEAGLHLDRRNKLAGDILIFDSQAMPIQEIKEHYADVPPKVAIKVDIMADLTDIHPDTYFFKKTQKLLDFGVEKVIWITTHSKKNTVATSHAPWQVMDWHEDVEVLNGIICNVGRYLTEKGSSLA